jgi:hypothetical protein
LAKDNSGDSPKNTSGSDQHKRFIETARELGCDEDEAAFDEKLKRIATAKPKSRGLRSATGAERARRSRTQPDPKRG